MTPGTISLTAPRVVPMPLTGVLHPTGSAPTPGVTVGPLRLLVDAERATLGPTEVFTVARHHHRVLQPEKVTI